MDAAILSIRTRVARLLGARGLPPEPSPRKDFTFKCKWSEWEGVPRLYCAEYQRETPENRLLPWQAKMKLYKAADELAALILAKVWEMKRHVFNKEKETGRRWRGGTRKVNMQAYEPGCFLEFIDHELTYTTADRKTYQVVAVQFEGAPDTSPPIRNHRNWEYKERPYPPPPRKKT